jgi:hypothetical protein
MTVDIPKKRSFLKRNSSFIAFLLVMAILGFLAQFQWVGYIILGIYAVYSLTKHISARTTFFLALLTLGMVPISVILANWLVAQNFAAYSFVLLVFGVITVIIELQRETRVRT